MTTEIENEAPPVVEDETERASLEAEAESLLELTKKKVNRDQTTPCPGCNILVPIQSNQCPHCESNIAANNALMRESIRRLEEIRAILDGRHKTHLQRHRDDDAAKPPVKERFKRFFSGQRPEEEPDDTPQLVDGPRVLDTVSEGDQLKVLECEGPWLKIKTREGRTGWVYSTLQPQR